MFRSTLFASLLFLNSVFAWGQDAAEPLIEVKDLPPVQMLIPGFVFCELPVQLRNLNNVRYRPDGKLYALGYDGDVWLLSDENGDGLEETSKRFFENQGRLRGPIGMQVIPAGHPLLGSPTDSSPEACGVIVASKGKVSALLDRDGDDAAEEERVIATGWMEIPQNVDAVGIAIDPKDGAIYFSLGTAAYNNAYLVDDQGTSAFDLKNDRGTIQRLDAKTLERTTVCTGIRFAIGTEFNAAGDLFVSEQEGATWLPNGNPFDELLHIRPGQHYGFPPRHPKHLPNVFDEPSECDYGPQHQSTCGICFNLSRQPGWETFGPEEWVDDLFVTGESRGKLYRTRVMKDARGRYIADNQLIGCLSMLTVDCCLTPKGQLLIACHSGGPDWGTGPTGMGKIFQVSYEHPELPRPTGVTLTGPQELQIQFSSPLDPALLKNLVHETSITYGQYVSAGDRFETLHPGYAVVQHQTKTPRFRLPVYSASVTPDRQTLVLATAPHQAAVGYAIQLPGLGRETVAPVAGELPQHAAVDLGYTLNGHELRQGQATTEFTTTINLRGLFRPVTQPGSQLDYNIADDQFIRSRKIQVQTDRLSSVENLRTKERFLPNGDAAAQSITIPVSADDESLPLSITSQSFASTGSWTFTWHVDLANGTTRSGVIPPSRLFFPWVDLQVSPAATVPTIPTELENSSWGRGRRVFHSDEAGCAKCHLADPGGKRIGPDLANLRHRDLTSVTRDIEKPSFAINPDFLGFTVVLKDGRVLTGTLHNEGENLLLGDKDGKRTTIARSDIEELKPATVSVMPEGITAKLGPAKMNDLLAYLLLPPPRMPSDAKEPPPEPRTRAEVNAVLSGATPVVPPLKPLNLLLVAGTKDHGPGEHDYPAWQREWRKLLEGAEGVTVATAMEWPTAEQLAAADTILFFQRGSWTPQRATTIDAHLKKGGGLVYIHWAVEGGPEAPAFAQRIGLASDASKIKYRHGPLDLGFDGGAKHPIARNFDKLHLHDESYWLLPGDPSRINVLATGEEEGARRPLFWTLEPNGGRVFVSIPGHYSWTFDDPLFRVLLLRGIAWSAGEPVDRFNELVWPGASVRD